MSGGPDAFRSGGPPTASAVLLEEAEPLLLAVDVGGTKIILALVRPDGSVAAEATYASRDFASLEAVVAHFRGAHPAPLRGAALSVAGPVIRGAAQITNLPWLVEESRLRATLQVEHVRLVNDLQGTAHALPYLRPSQTVTLQRGAPEADGPRAVIAVGTGLGGGMLLRHRGEFLAVASEGGHTDFAPRTALQRGLLAALQREHDHVSYERVCSGPGIIAIYRHLRARSGAAEPAWLTAALAAATDQAPVIAEAALGTGGRCPVARRALCVFAEILGAAAGNLALRALATGGVYVGGGIPPRVLPALRSRAFARGFLCKGPMSAVVARIPVHVVMEPRTALLGAARYGLAHA